MALGTNIEYKASALFQATMDEKSAKETEKRFVELSKRAAEMSREEFEQAFRNLGEVINKSLSKLKIAPIDMNQIIKLPQADAFSKLGTEFGARFADNFQGAVGSGISASVQEEIKRLEADRDKLISLQKRIPKRLEKYEYLASLDSVEKGDVKAFSLDDINNLSKGGTADELASKLRSEYDALASSLDNLDRNTKEYYQTLVKTYEAASNLYRMRAAMDKHPTLVTDNDVLLDYDYESLNISVGEYLVDNNHSKAFAQYIESQEALLDKIPRKLHNIEQQLNNIQQSNSEIINKEEANTGLKTLNEIEAAYQRILNAHKKVGKQGRNIQDALSFDPTTSKEGIQSLYKNVTQMPEDAPWEVQYQALLKYVKLYESYLNSDNSIHRNKVTKPYNEFTTLYEQLKPLAANAENMLRNVLNMAENKPLVGMGGAEADSVGGNVADANIVSDNISEQNQLVQQYNANKEKTLALLKKEQLSYEEILYLVKEVQTEYAKSFFGNKNYDLGDDAISLMTSVYGKLRRGDMIDPRLDKAINGVGISAEDGARILADYQNKQVGVAGSDDSEIDVNAEAKARVEAEAKAKADTEQAVATEREKVAQEALVEAERKSLENTKLNLALKKELTSATEQQKAVMSGEIDAKESMRLVGENGVLSTVQGQDFTVDAKTMVTQLASNLKNSIVMSLHDHPNAMDMFTPDDVDTFAKLYYGQGIKVNGIIANGVIKTIDFTGISQDIAIKIGQSFSENLSRAAQQSGLFTYKNKNIIPVEEVQSWMSSDPDKYEQAIDGIRDMVDASLNDAFKQNGVESTLQQFKKSQLPELTQQLLELQRSGENAVAPIEKLKNLLVTIKPNHNFDWSNYADVLGQFEKGSLNGLSVVNKVLAQINAETQAQETPIVDDTSKLQEENTKLDEQNSKLKENINLKAQANGQSVATGMGTGDASSEDLRAAQDEADRLKSELNEANERVQYAESIAEDERYIRRIAEENLSESTREKQSIEKRATEAEAEAERLKQELANTQATSANSTGGDSTNTNVEMTQMTGLKEAVEAVTTAVNLKTEAFKTEEDVVKSVVDNEINHLIPLKEVLETISTLIHNIKSNNNLDAGLSNVVINVNHTDTQQNDFNQVVDAISKINIQSAPVTDIGNVLATENTLNAIKTAVESINNKVKQGTRVETVSNEPIEDNEKEMVLYNAEPDSQFSGGGSKKPTEKIKTALTALLKYKTTLQEANQLSGDLEAGINSLYMELSQVSDKDELMIWNEHFKQFKNASSIIQTLVKDYQELGAMQAKANEETDPTKLAHYLDNIEIIQDRINTKSADVNVGDDRFEKARQRAYNTTQHELQQRQELASATQAENEALAKQEKTFQKLIDATSLYNQMLIGAEKAKTSEEKSAYTQNAEAALAEQEKLLQSITLTKEQQAEFDELEIERTRQLALMKAKKTGRENQIHNAQVEAEIVKQLVKLYEKLGKAQYLKNNKEATNIRQQIGTERAKLSSVDYSTDMKFKAAKEKGFNAEQTKAKTEAENKALNKRKQVIAELIKLYEQYAQISVRAGFADGKNLSDKLNAEAEEIYQKITDTEKLLGSISSEEKQAFLKAMDKGIAQEESSQLEKIAKSIDKDEADRLKELGKEYEKLGKLQARTDLADGEYEKKYLKELVESQKEIIRLKQQGLNIDESLYNTKYIEAYEKELDALNIKIARQKDKADSASFKDAVKQSQKDAGVSKAGSLVNKATTTLGEAMQIEGLTPDKVSLLERFNNEVLKLNSQYQEASRKDTLVTPEQEQALKAQAQNVDKLTKEVNELIAEYQRLSGDNATVIGSNSIVGDANINEYKKQLTDAVMAATNGKAKITEFDASTKTLHYTVKTGSHEFTEYAASVRHLDNSLVSLQGSTKKTETFLEGIRRKTKEIFMYLGGSSTIYRAFAELKKGVQYVREIDSALTELKKVTDETEKTYDRFLQTAAKTADKVGSTIQEVVSSTADWARIGYSLKDAANLAESTAVLLNVSEFQSIEDATSALTSTLQAFGYTAKESMNVVDVLNEVGNNFAISSDGIATALQDSASSLMAANNSYQEAVALIAAANRVVQDPNSVGAALRTISLRLRGTSTEELEEAGEDTAGAITSKSKLRSKIKGYTGIDILTDSGAYKSTYEILLEISKVWDDLTDVNRAGLLEMIAGKTRSNTAAAILSNTKDLEEAYRSAMEAEGSAYEENEKYLDSIQGKIDLFNNAIQTMWSNLLDADIIKNVVSWGTKIIQSLDTMQGKLLALVKAIAILMAYKKINPLDWIQNIGNLFTTIQDTGIKQFIKSILGIAPAIKVVTAETLANTVAIQLNDTAKTKDMMTSMGLASATGTLSAAQKEQAATAILNAMSTGQLTIAQGNAMLAMLGYAGATLTADGSLKLLDKTTKSFMATNPMGWILAIVSVIMMAVTWISSWQSETEKLEEELSSLNSEINTIKGELDSLNSELETTKDRMAELLALPSLSLTEQEELKNLQLQNAELEQRIKLQEALLETQEQTRVDTAKDWINSVWNGKNLDKKYAISPEGVITEDKWDTRGISGKDAINSALKEYRALQEENLIVDEILAAAKQEYDTDEKLSADTRKAIADLYSKNGVYSTYKWDAETSIRNLENRIALNDSDLSEISTGVNTVLGDMANTISENGLSYALGDTDINAFLDEYYAQFDAWQVAQGKSNKSDVIANMFGSLATEEVKELGTQLKEIANDEKLTLDQQKAKIEGVINSLDEENSAYNALKQTMDTVDIRAENIADYFVESATIDSSTIEGIAKQYANALNIMNQLKSVGEDGSFSIGENDYNWNEFFSEDDEGKFEARADKFSEILNGMDKEARNTFMSLSESVKNGELTWQQAIKSFEHSGNLAGLKVVEAQIIELNNTEFSNISDEISGVIDTFEELSAALDDVASSMELLNTAQTQMNNSGRISVKTALEIMQSTDQWNEILEIENGNIKLVGDATEILVEDKIALIKANLQNALATVTEQLAMIDSQNASEDLATTMEESTNQAVRKLAGSMAYLTKMMEAYTRAANGEYINVQTFMDDAKAAQEAVESELNWKVNAANKVGKGNLEKRKSEIEAQLAMLEGIDTTSEFKNNYDYDKTPGDKYDDDSGDLLDALRKKYERQIKNLDNQQTYLQNEIDRLEAENKTVSKSYYEDQIAIEEKKLDLYEQEREALLKLKMTDEVAEALWEVEHAIQESALSMVEFRKSIIELYKTAFDDVIEAYDNKDDFLSDQQNYIEKYRELMELQGKTPDAYGYQEQIANEEEKMADNIAELNSLRQTLAEGMVSGYIEEGSEEWIDMQDQIRATEEAILDNKIALEEYRKELKQLSVDAFELVREAFSNKDNFFTNQQEYIQGYADLLEAQGIDVPAEIYDELMKIEQEKRTNNVANLVDARQGLADIEAKGYTAADEEWQDAYQQVVDLEKAVQDNDIAMAEYAKTIRDLDFDKFERFISRLDDANSEMDNLRGLYDDEDVAFEDGSWTKEGMTSLGLAYHQMELNKQKTQEYAEKIEELNQSYDNGEMSEQEYYERLQELKDGQWDAINAYESTKDSIVDLEEARIDMIEEGINKEIEAYEDLIKVKKEELDAERDLYDFKKNVQKQTKDIASLERRIASLSGSTDASDIAERRKLEAELYEAQEGLNDTYYGHSKDQQSQALDDELNAYQEAQDKYLEMLRETLDNTTEIINAKIVEVLTNADVVLDEVNTKADGYNLTLNPLLTSPWEAASERSFAFKTEAQEYLTGLLNEETGIIAFSTDATGKLVSPFEAGSEAAELFAQTIGINLGALGASGFIASFGTDTDGKLDSVFTSGNTAAGNFKTAINGIIEGVKTIVFNSTSPLTSNLKLPWENATKADSPISTFSTKVKGAIEGALTTAQNNATKMKTALTSPWTDGTNAVNTFSTKAKTALDEVKKKADETAASISKVKQESASVPNHVGNSNNGSSGGGNTPSTPASSSQYKTGADVKKLQTFLNQYWNTAVYNGTGSSQLSTDGSYGPLTKKAVQAVQKILGMNTSAQNGEWNIATTTAMTNYYRGKMREMANYPSSVAEYEKRWRAMPTAIYAKGTLGTKRDEFAITDESWIGEEITLAAGRNGQLQYLKKGSAVMPADISANLIEWGQINPDLMKLDTCARLNMINNAMNRAEFNMTFDSLVHVDYCDESTLKDLEKMVDTKINQFSKQMNYAIKKFGGR